MAVAQYGRDVVGDHGRDNELGGPDDCSLFYLFQADVFLQVPESEFDPHSPQVQVLQLPPWMKLLVKKRRDQHHASDFGSSLSPDESQFYDGSDEALQLRSISDMRFRQSDINNH